MPVRLAAVVLDVADLKRAASFWSQALGYDVTSEGDAWVGLAHPRGEGVDLGLQPRGDRKADVNRMHVDLAAEDVQAEVRRLERLGARRAQWPYYPEKASWVVMEDPDGNEFCVVPA